MVSVIGQGTNQNLPSVIIDDGADHSASAYNLTFESNRLTGFGSKEGISYTQEANVNVWLGGQSNDLQLLSSISGSTNIQSTNAEPDTFDIVSKPISLQGTVTLHGSVGGNQFRFANGAGFTNGILIGGVSASHPAYFNLLNYAAYSTPVTVNLGTQTASGTASVNGIDAVLGGSANDNLTADNGDDVLNGGLGSNTLTGAIPLNATGIDILYGGPEGAGVNRIIGGSSQAIVVLNSAADFNNGSVDITFQTKFTGAGFGDDPCGPPTCAGNRRTCDALTATMIATTPAASNKSSVAAGIFFSGQSQQVQISNDYLTLLGRSPSASDFAFWQAQMTAGASSETVAISIAGSPEFFAHAGGTNTSFVQALYTDFLGRSASSGEISFWSNLVPSLGDAGVANQIAGSPEGLAHAVNQLYNEYLGRNVEASAAAYWMSQLQAQNGSSAFFNQIALALLTSSEFSGNGFKQFGNVSVGYIQELYFTLFNGEFLPANSPEAAFWLGILDNPSGPLS